MKHALKLTAMLAAVLMLAACNKEKELTPDTVATTQVRDITYTVADRTTTVHLETDTEFEALIVQFCNYAQQGDSVTFYNGCRHLQHHQPRGDDTLDATDGRGRQDRHGNLRPQHRHL